MKCESNHRGTLDQGCIWDGPQFCILTQPGLIAECLWTTYSAPPAVPGTRHLWPLFCDRSGKHQPPGIQGTARPLSSWQVLSRVPEWDKKQSKGLQVRLGRQRAAMDQAGPATCEWCQRPCWSKPKFCRSVSTDGLNQACCEPVLTENKSPIFSPGPPCLSAAPMKSFLFAFCLGFSV